MNLIKRFKDFLRPYKYYLIRKKNYKKVITNNSVIKVLFVIQRIEVFNSVKSIIDEMGKNDIFDIYFLPIPRNKTGENNALDFKSYGEIKNFCYNLKCGRVIDCYNNESFIELDDKYDYIFLNVPYSNQYPEKYSLHYLSRHGNLCYIPYGTGYSKNNALLYTSYNLDLLSHISYLFAASPSTYRFSEDKLHIWEKKFKKKIVYDVGYPRFDLLRNVKNNNKISTILYLPRWTTNNEIGNEKSSFIDFKDSFFNIANNHPDINFIMRPHPLMFDNLLKNKIITEEELENILIKFDSCKNVHLDNSKNYLDSLIKADCLICDFSSIVIEYFLLNRPIIYLGNIKSIDDCYSKMVESFYIPDNLNQIESLIDSIIVNDCKLNARIDAINDFNNNISKEGATQNILNILINDFYDKKNS